VCSVDYFGFCSSPWYHHRAPADAIEKYTIVSAAHWLQQQTYLHFFKKNQHPLAVMLCTKLLQTYTSYGMEQLQYLPFLERRSCHKWRFTGWGIKTFS
jgi:hypothetical protein